MPFSLLLPLIYGSAFTDATRLLLILLPGVYLVGLGIGAGPTLQRARTAARIPVYWVVTLIVNLVMVFALVPR